MPRENLLKQALFLPASNGKSVVATNPSATKKRRAGANGNARTTALLPAIQASAAPFHLSNRRYIGNKHKLTDWIFSIIGRECEGDSFADLFAGSGAVAAAACRRYKRVFVNDLLHSNQIFYEAFFNPKNWSKKKTDALIQNYNGIAAADLQENYFSRNFGGKYFSRDSAKIIGFIREDIKNGNLTPTERRVLLASLLYSADKIANTVGHYDAYFKKKEVKDRFVMRAISPFAAGGVSIFRQDANALVKKIRADIAYIDPPYNSRQYSRFYHVLETLAKWDKPALRGVALKPPPENMSDYCRVAARAKFSALVGDIAAKYIVVSYNNTYDAKSSSSENKISLSDMERILKKRGETKVFEKNYRHFNAGATCFADHKEYLFVTRVAQQTRRSPLFYVGDKHKLIRQIFAHFPDSINSFYEPFVGGGSVFLNARARRYCLGDADKRLMEIHQCLLSRRNDAAGVFADIEKLTRKYGLSFSYKGKIPPLATRRARPKTYFARFNKDGYLRMRTALNEGREQGALPLYVLLIYGFNRMLRFNANGKFNLPVGNVDFNGNAARALDEYFSFVRGKDINFSALDFRDFLQKTRFCRDDFVYLDPPYLVAASEYNKRWGADDDKDLFCLLDKLNDRGVRFALSNVVHYNGRQNAPLIKWMKGYRAIEIDSGYINYHNNGKKPIREVLIVNY